MTKTPQKSTYIAKADGWVAGQRVKAGDELSLTPGAARYEPVALKQSGRPARASRSDAPEAKAPPKTAPKAPVQETEANA